MQLSPRLRAAIERTLRELYPIWKDRAYEDQRRELHQVGPGHLEISIRTYPGFRTMIAAENTIFKQPAVQALGEAMAQEAPLLLKWIYWDAAKSSPNDAISWLYSWMQFLDQHTERGFEHGLRLLFESLDEVLATGKAEHTTTVLLTGMTLNEGKDIFLGTTPDGAGTVILHPLLPEEFTEATAIDITYSSPTNLDFVHSLSAIVIKRPMVIRFSEGEPGLPRSVPFQVETRQITELALKALHIGVEGTVGIQNVLPSVTPTCAPLPVGNASRPPSLVFIPSMNIETSDAERIPEIYRLLLECRPEIRIAAGRLMDAEARINHADSVVDCTIGLETLLNPTARDELTFRV